MSNKINKPKYSSHDLVQKMKNEKGIKFVKVSELDAENYLYNINNFLRTTCYRKNFDKYQRGDKAGKYINLDFAYLQELSVLDMYLRNIIINMTIDIEHDLKVLILKTIEKSPAEDGYSIVKDYLTAYPKILKKIESMSSSSFTNDLIHKYFTISFNASTQKNEITNFDDCPVWVLMEFLTFSDTMYFYEFLFKRLKKSLPIQQTMLNLVRSLRNSCAHNNCLLSNLRKKTNTICPDLSQSVAKIQTISKASRKRNLSCRQIQEFTALMFLYNTFVSENVRKKRKTDLYDLIFKRMTRHKFYFARNSLIVSSYEYVSNLLNYLR